MGNKSSSRRASSPFDDLVGGDADIDAILSRGSSSSTTNTSNYNNNTEQRRQQRKSSPTEQKPSYIALAKQGYKELVNAIVRPPRATYSLENLGPSAFKFQGKTFTRTDFDLDTIQGEILKCSHWEPVERETGRIPCVVYMHGNSSARVESIGVLSYVLSLGISLFAVGCKRLSGRDVDQVCFLRFLRAVLRPTNLK